MSVLMRIPDEVAEQARRLGMLKGVTTGAMLAEAWRWHLERNAERYAQMADELAADLRGGLS